MTLRQYLFIMTFATALCWTAWVFVLYRIDPFTANALSFGFFYSSLFLALLGTISIILFMLYYFFSRTAFPMYRFVQRSFRNAIIVSLSIIFLLVLQGLRVLALWNMIILAILAVIAGVFILSINTSKKEMHIK